MNKVSRAKDISLHEQYYRCRGLSSNEHEKTRIRDIQI